DHNHEVTLNVAVRLTRYVSRSFDRFAKISPCSRADQIAGAEESDRRHDDGTDWAGARDETGSHHHGEPESDSDRDPGGPRVAQSGGQAPNRRPTPKRKADRRGGNQDDHEPSGAVVNGREDGKRRRTKRDKWPAVPYFPRVRQEGRARGELPT